MASTLHIHACWPSAPFTRSLVLKATKALSLSTVITQEAPTDSSPRPVVQWSTYDCIDHEIVFKNPSDVLSSSYTFRKALIRKHYLSRCIQSYLAKRPQSVLKKVLPRTYEIEIAYADELDEMWTDELWELGQDLDSRSSWWILKPGMADRGMGVRLFNSKETLTNIFEEFDGNSDEEGEEESDTGVTTSQLRHFVVQEYISNPLLIDPSDVQEAPKGSERGGFKFHLRVYCVASGAIQVYAYNRVLALFSSVPYTEPEDSDSDGPINLAAHLTNTSLQVEDRGEFGVRLLDELVGCQILSSTDGERFSQSDVDDIFKQILDALADSFQAALQLPTHFQPLPNAFELYGVDFLVEHIPVSSGVGPRFQIKLLEFNAEPAIEMTGPRLAWILEDLFGGIGKACIEPFFDRSIGAESWRIGEVRYHLTKCYESQVRGFEPPTPL